MFLFLKYLAIIWNNLLCTNTHTHAAHTHTLNLYQLRANTSCDCECEYECEYKWQFNVNGSSDQNPLWVRLKQPADCVPAAPYLPPSLPVCLSLALLLCLLLCVLCYLAVHHSRVFYARIWQMTSKQMITMAAVGSAAAPCCCSCQPAP